MAAQDTPRLSVPATGMPPTSGLLTHEELQLATRNRGMPLEALRYDVTPTGLHYLLVHFDIPFVRAEDWRLKIGGLVSDPIELTLENLAEFPRVTIPVTLECAGNGRARLHPRPVSQPWLVEAIGTAIWSGVWLVDVLERAGLDPNVRELVFTGRDHGSEKGREHDYARSLALADALRPEVMLAFEMNGRPLEPQHRFPLRLVVPGWYGMAQVKWLDRIDAVAEPFQGYQQRVAYHFRANPDDPGTPVERIRPRALMVPPGFPDFLTRQRTVDRGTIVVEGRAWAGATPISHVEFGVDGAWQEAELGEPLGPFAWRGWSASWAAEPGEHVLSCRATDASGNIQPLDPPWNWHGMGNNLVQFVPVTVR